MNILQIANKGLYPPDGGSLAILSLTRAYIKNGHNVHLLNIITHKHSNNKFQIEAEYKDFLKLTGVFVNTQIIYFKLILNFLFSSKPYISNRFISKQFNDKIVSTINNESFDFIQIEGLYALQYIKTIRKNYKGKILYRSHNIEFLIWKRNYQMSLSIFKKVYFKSMYKRLLRLEKRLINTYDYLIPISQSDEYVYKKLGNKKPVLTSPFGINIESLEKQDSNSNIKTEQTISYIGALDWIPNQEGLLWFVDECFPLILRTYPNIKLNVAGRNAPDWLVEKLKHNNILFKGEVDNAYDFIQAAGPMIVPLFSGSGMRVKIIEGMALKKGIVATTIASEGINCSHNTNILLADNKKDFTDSIIAILENPDIQTKIGLNAFEFVKKNYNFRIIGSDILNFIK